MGAGGGARCCCSAPIALAAVWAIDDPAAAIGVVPAQFQGAAEPGGGAGALSGGDQAALASEIFTNNIRVTFLAIAGGIFAGLGTAAVPIFNGGFIGAILGLTIENGSSSELLRLILPHGVLELSCIAVAATRRAADRLGAGRPRDAHARPVAAARGAAGDGARARHDAVARARRPGRGLRDRALAACPRAIVVGGGLGVRLLGPRGVARRLRAGRGPWP